MGGCGVSPPEGVGAGSAGVSVGAGDWVVGGASVAEVSLYFSAWPSRADLALSVRAFESQRSGRPQDSQALASSRRLFSSTGRQIDRPSSSAATPSGVMGRGLAFSAA